MSPALPIRNLGVIAHIDAGKTTLSERILYYTHKEHSLGEVDAGTATLDWMPEEQRRGITITAAATTVIWNNHRLNLIDTPGHVDFTAEVERSLRVLDGAIGVFCGAAGVQAQSETVWRQADKYRVPRIAFVNKLDRPGSDFFRVVESIRTRLHANAVPVQIPIGSERAFDGLIDLVERRSIRFDEASLGAGLLLGEIDPELREEADHWRSRLIEAAAELDDDLLEAYLGGREVSAKALRAAIRKGTLSRKLVPVLGGAALRNKGVQPVLNAVCDYLPSPEDLESVTGLHPDTRKEVTRRLSPEEPFAALAFKTVADPHGDLVYLRVYSGRLGEGEQVWNSRTERKDRAQKIYFMHANHREKAEAAEAGNIVAVVGFKETATGDTLTHPSHRLLLERPIFPEAVVSMAIEPVSIAARDKLTEALDRLLREDPTFRWRSDKDTGQLVISGMGELHLEVIRDRLLREFKVDAMVGAPRVAYRQTIAAAAESEGLFEKTVGGRSLHAQVRLRLEPEPEGARPAVESRLSKAEVPLEFHSVILDALKDAIESGGLLGFPLMKLRAIVLGGDFRPQESTPPAYGAAAAQAFQAALERAGVVILEPVMRFEIQVPDVYYGAVSTDLQKRRASIRGVDLAGEIRVLEGQVPLAEVFGYSNQLRSLSQGRGSISLEPLSYAPVPPQVAERFRL